MIIFFANGISNLLKILLLSYSSNRIVIPPYYLAKWTHLFVPNLINDFEY
jgi:hypothetical protein